MKLLVLLALTAACTTASPVGMGYTLPKETPSECNNHCKSIGMHMSAVVIVANSVGCVCEPDAAAPAGHAAGGTAAAAGAVVVAEQEQQAAAAAAAASSRPR